MDPHSILARGQSDAPPQDQPAMLEWPGTKRPGDEAGLSGGVRFPGEDGGKSLTEMAERDLAATLQLLAERAQYITGGTGAAIALRDGDDLLCKASAGASAPEVGAQLQVNSGLSGESVRTRQTLRCDDTANDNRVNRESCQALGIASVVVMPLLRDGLVIGVFELFSDKPNAFQERDITALERLGSMVHTALDCAEAARKVGARPVPAASPEATGSVPLEKSVPVQAPGVAKSPIPKAETAGGEVFQPVDEAPRSGHTAAAPPLHFPPRIAFHGLPAANRPAVETPVAGPEAVIAQPQVAPEASEVEVPAAPEDSAPQEVNVAEMIAVSGGEEEILAEAPPALAEAATEEEQLLVAQPDEVQEEAAPEMIGAAPAEAPPPVVAASAVAQERSVPVAEPAVRDAVLDMFEAPAPKKVPAPPQPAPPPVEATPDQAKARSEVASLKRCEACGFPVSGGRVLCLDCEKKERASGVPLRAAAPAPAPAPAVRSETQPAVPEAAEAITQVPAQETVPFFLGAEEEAEADSWVSSHKYLVAAIAMALMGVVALLLSR